MVLPLVTLTYVRIQPVNNKILLQHFLSGKTHQYNNNNNNNNSNNNNGQS